LFEAAMALTGATHPLVAGDRLDTDISGAAAMGWDSLLVLTGTSRPVDLPAAPRLPTYVAPDLSVVLRDPPPARFRIATASDAPAVRRLLASAGLSADGVEGRLNNTLVCSRGEDGERREPARQNGEIAAAASLEPIDGFGVLRSVAVREDLRGEGLGMLVAAAAIHRGREAGISIIALFTETSVSFFERLGFQTVERNDLPEPIRTSRHAAEECAESATPMILSL
jgi:N-acetylglutamate synthase-like GNAT family acetyltransferase